MLLVLAGGSVALPYRVQFTDQDNILALNQVYVLNCDTASVGKQCCLPSSATLPAFTFVSDPVVDLHADACSLPGTGFFPDGLLLLHNPGDLQFSFSSPDPLDPLNPFKCEFRVSLSPPFTITVFCDGSEVTGGELTFALEPIQPFVGSE